jgi:hypothetical protein
VDQSGVEHYLLGEVGKADEVEKTLSIKFFSDGKWDHFSWSDQDTTKILKVNDVTAADLFKTCGALAIGLALFFGRNKKPVGTDAPEKEYLPATVIGYDADTQKHQLRLPAEVVRLDLSKGDVRLVQPSATDTTEPPSPPTKAERSVRAAAARTAAQLPVHTGTAHTANINTLTERSALTPHKGKGKRSSRTAAQLPVHTDIAHTAKAKRTTRTDALIPVHTGTAHTANINTLTKRPAPTPRKGKGKRSLVSANDLPSPTTATRKTQNRTAKKALPRLSKTENPTNDAPSLAFEDPAKPTPLTNPFSVDTSRKLDFDCELPADPPGFLSASCAKAVSSPSESFLPDNDDDVFFPSTDAPMPELNSRKRTFRSSRSTDAKTSETSVADDATQPPPNSSPGEQQQQQQRVYKKANKRVNKKVKRES